MSESTDTIAVARSLAAAGDKRKLHDTSKSKASEDDIPLSRRVRGKENKQRKSNALTPEDESM